MKSGNLLLFFILLVSLVSSCTGVKYLEDGEKLLYNQSLKGVEKASKSELSAQITLSPNIRFPIIGPVGAFIYETGENNFDTASVYQKRKEFIERTDNKILAKQSKERSTNKLESRKTRRLERFQNKLRNGNFRMRTGSPLAVYDDYAIENSKSRMEIYLKNKGFSKATVKIETKEKKRKVDQTFIINEGPQLFLDSLILRTGDSTLTKLINSSEVKSFLKKGDTYSKDNVDAERARIETLLRDNGYFEFNKRFIEFNAYFDPESKDLWLSTIVNKPADKPFHKIYQMDSIIFNTSGSDIPIDTTNFEDITYTFGFNDYSPKVLDTRMIFRKKALYNNTDVINTQRQLLSIDMFRYANINFDTTLVEGKMIANIYSAPLKKFQLSQELGANVSQGYPGPFYNLSFKNRNVFGGLEILELTGFIGSEGIAQATANENRLTSFQYGGNLALSFPRFITPFPSRRLNLETFNPKTTVSLGYSFTDRPEYVRTNINGTLSYRWQNLKANRSYTLNLADANLINTLKIDPVFEDLLNQLANQGNTLILSFNPSFVSSTSFNATINNDYSNTKAPSSFFRYFIEAAGTSFNFVGTGLLERQELAYYQFLKFQADYKRYYPLKNKSSFVFRANAGLADPYIGRKQGINALPYEKFFFTGGSNSNRAWSPRRLGPGSSSPYLLDASGNNVRDEDGLLVPDLSNNSYQFEQPGEVLLELNAEYRSNIVGFLDWAVFVDAGNVWRLSENIQNNTSDVTLVSPGAKFELNRFYKEIAVGAGIGLRFDFSFLVFRLDVGHKLKDPRYEEGKRWRKLFSQRSQTVFNIAVGYPF
ncbi:MAG: hypothetical protein ACJAS3_003214 [Roseivirga sp.]